MSPYNLVREQDYHALLGVTAELATLPPDAIIRRKFILESLRRHIGAEVASIFDAADPMPAGVAIVGSLTSVNTSPGDHRVLHDYLTTTPMDSEAVVLALTERVLSRRTVLRDDFVQSRDWYRSGYFNLLFRRLGADDHISCRVRRPNGGWSGVCFMREAGNRAFGERDRQVVDLFSHHAAHLYDAPQSAPQRQLSTLPPRLRPVVQALLDGDAEKQVAIRLGLSQHTVHTYVKQIYQCLGVSSRGELFARLRSVSSSQ